MTVGDGGGVSSCGSYDGDRCGDAEVTHGTCPKFRPPFNCKKVVVLLEHTVKKLLSS